MFNSIADGDMQSAYSLHTSTDCIETSCLKTARVGKESEGTKEEEKKPHACKFCEKSFRYPSLLVIHQRIHTGEKTHVCQTCTMPFTNASTLKDHERFHRARNGAHACKFPFCNKTFDQPSQLVVHERSHTGEKPCICRTCGKAYRSTSNLRVHERLHAKEEVRPFVCQTCTKSFGRLETLMRHEVIHTQEKPHARNIITSAVDCIAELKLRDGIDTGQKTNTCDRNHRGKKQYICNLCGKAYRHKVGLQYHEYVHKGRKPHVCKFCKRAFRDLARLRRHREIHAGDKPYICRICKERFAHVSILRLHEGVHADEKPYVCKHCNKRFSRLGNARIHETIHTGEKPFGCRVCTKAFRYHEQRRVHECVHTGQKPYVCFVCSKAFVARKDWVKHGAKHTERKKEQEKFTVDSQRSPSAGQRRKLTTAEMWADVYSTIMASVQDQPRNGRFAVKPFGCGVCDEMFAEEDRLIKHFCLRSPERKLSQ